MGNSGEKANGGKNISFGIDFLENRIKQFLMHENPVIQGDGISIHIVAGL